MFILKKGHQPGVYVPLRALFLVSIEIEFKNDLAYKGGLLSPIFSSLEGWTREAVIPAVILKLFLLKINRNHTKRPSHHFHL